MDKSHSSQEQLPVLELKSVGSGWGPTIIEDPGKSVLAEFQGLPFQQYNKCDRIGRVVDWLGGDRYKKGDARDRYNERMYGSSAAAGSQFDYVHDNEDASFQLVDTSKPQKPQKNYRRGGFQFRKLFNQREHDRREQQRYAQGSRTKREFEKERMRLQKAWQRKGAMRGAGIGGMRGGRRFGDRQAGKNRQASVEVLPEWKVLEELDFSRLAKLSYPNVEPGQDIPGQSYGVLHYLDRAMDKASVRAPIPLKRYGGRVYQTATTTEDPVIEKLMRERVGNVFGTDVIIASLMASNRSVYSWDVVVERVKDMLIFDKRSIDVASVPTNPIDGMTVSETSPEMNQDSGQQKTPDINTQASLAQEAWLIGENFRRQAVRLSDKPHQLEHANDRPFDDDDAGAAEKIPTGCKYRLWSLGSMGDGTPIRLVVRADLDAISKVDNDNVQQVTVRAFNEWDSSVAGGVDWRSKLETQKGAVLATEVRNNNYKVAKWNIQALLAGSDYIRFGYVSRVNTRGHLNHEILGVHQARPTDFARSVGMNLDNSWGILRAIIDFFMKKPQGKYLLLKDPIQSVIRIYSLPAGTFESDEDDDESDEESDEEDGDDQGPNED